MATIKDIAEACQVSKATVSRYINGSGYVSEAVGQRIAAKIEELNYIPSATARNLSNRKNNVIGVVIPEVSNPFFAEVFKGISQLADKHDLSIFYCDTDNDEQKELKALAMLRSYEIQGVILTPATGGMSRDTYSEDFVQGVKGLNVPVVLLDRDVAYENWDGVFINNYKGSYDLTECLLDQGHKDIAAITGDMSLTIGQERFRGYREAFEARGKTVNPSLVVQGDFSSETAYEGMLELLDGPLEFSAVYSSNNLTTLGILKALNERGLRIPEDIAFAGFDDIDILTTLNIHLTVVKRDNIAMGRQALELLLGRMNGTEDEAVKRIVMEPSIIRRGSEKSI